MLANLARPRKPSTSIPPATKQPRVTWLRCFSLGLAVLMLSAASRPALAVAPVKVLNSGEQLDDQRLGDLKTLNDYFPMEVPESVDAWQRRSEALRRQVRVALGLWPWPTRTPLNPVIHGRIDQPDYTVEKVFFESYPGHFVSGNLYRPKDAPGERPGVLCPHGHWQDGRFYDVSEKDIRWSIVRGEERFEQGGRSPLQARCVQLARMGCVVFHYDMVGYADSGQLSHRPGMREAMNTNDGWGYFSPQAELRMQNMMGLQAWNSMRALDFLTGLPDVDEGRIAVTGASGGGTQTFILGAIDPRPQVIFPAVMVSTAMQGGCTCENACYLRVGAGNIDLAALFAPKPLGMTGADDWTKEIMSKGLPELKQLYKLLGAPENVMAQALVQFKHNYNYVSRAVMYHWLNKHLELGFEEPIVEQDYPLLSREEMSVWNESHPAPPGGPEHERELLQWQTADAEQQLAAMIPSDPESLAVWRETVGGAFDVLLGRDQRLNDQVAFEKRHENEDGDIYQYAGLIHNETRNESLPAVFLYPQDWNEHVVVWVDARGKRGLWDEQGKLLKPAVRELLARGTCVAGVDLLYQGESLPEGEALDQQPMVGKARGDYAGYTFGYNYPLFAKRVHDLLSVVTMIRNDEHAPQRIDLVGLNETGPLVAAARALLGELIGRAVVDTEGFRFETLQSTSDVRFLPGAVKYGDLPALIALAAPHPTLLFGEGDELPELIGAAYAASGSLDAFKISDAGDLEEQSETIVEWLSD